jgi:glycosyltransferase involved in cell wall biosynthesis
VGRAGEWLLEIEAEHRPDVVHLNGYAHGALPWESPVLVAGHSCVLSWWRAVKGEEAPPEWDRYRDAVGRGLRAADVVVAPSRAMLAELRRLYGPLREATVIYNGRDAARFSPCAQKEPLVLAAGRLWDEAKNLATLERAAPDIPWRVYVAGDDASPDGAAVEARRTRPLGRLDEQSLAGWMGRASVYALPARYEPFGLSVLEAALSGCALVLGDIPSLREVWADAALYAPPDDAHVLSATIRRLAASRTLRAEMSRRALARALQYTPARMTKLYLLVYRQLLEASASAASGAGETTEAIPTD